MCANFKAKRTTLTFSALICPKRYLEFEIQKSIAWIRISIPAILCVPIFWQNEQLRLFGPKFAQKWILGSKFQKINGGIRNSILEIPYMPIFRQNGELWLFGLKFAQIWVIGFEFQKSKSGFGINICKLPCEPIFSQNGQLRIFRPKFGEIAQLCAIFWLEYCWGCCRELGGGWNEQQSVL